MDKYLPARTRRLMFHLHAGVLIAAVFVATLQPAARAEESQDVENLDLEIYTVIGDSPVAPSGAQDAIERSVVEAFIIATPEPPSPDSASAQEFDGTPSDTLEILSHPGPVVYTWRDYSNYTVRLRDRAVPRSRGTT